MTRKHKTKRIRVSNESLDLAQQVADFYGISRKEAIEQIIEDAHQAVAVTVMYSTPTTSGIEDNFMRGSYA